MRGRFFLFFCLVGISLSASGFCSEIVVQRVEFNLVEQAGARDPWYEIAVTLNVERGDPESTNPRFSDEVMLSLDFATETEARGMTGYEFYAATAVYPTLEVGRKVARFYLPPEIAKRDRLRGEPFAWRVFVRERGEELASLTSQSLDSDSALASYQSRLTAEVSATEGVLRMQVETPFRFASPRDTPNARLRVAGE